MPRPPSHTKNIFLTALNARFRFREFLRSERHYFNNGRKVVVDGARDDPPSVTTPQKITGSANFAEPDFVNVILLL